MLCCLHSLIRTNNFQRVLTASVDSCVEIMSASSVAKPILEGRKEGAGKRGLGCASAARNERRSEKSKEATAVKGEQLAVRTEKLSDRECSRRFGVTATSPLHPSTPELACVTSDSVCLASQSSARELREG